MVETDQFKQQTPVEDPYSPAHSTTFTQQTVIVLSIIRWFINIWISHSRLLLHIVEEQSLITLAVNSTQP